MTIGERIKLRREELKMTQEELANKCGYKSRSSINKIELSRDLPLNKVKLMADALQTTPSHLMGWDETVSEMGKTLFTIEQELKNDPKRIVNTILFNNNENAVKMSEETLRAIKFYELYEKADPNIKDAIDTLLRGNAPDSNSKP